MPDQETGQRSARVAKYAGRARCRLKEGDIATPEVAHERAATGFRNALRFLTREQDVPCRRRTEIAAPKHSAENDALVALKRIGTVDAWPRACGEDLEAGTIHRSGPA